MAAAFFPAARSLIFLEDCLRREIKSFGTGPLIQHCQRTTIGSMYFAWLWWVVVQLWLMESCCSGQEHPLVENRALEERRLYIATVDGTLTAVDVEGHTLWQHHFEPLFSSTLSHGKPSESVPDLIPGLDKHLYHWDGSRLQRLLDTADDLIDRKFPYTKGFTFVGAKVREVVGLNIKSGQALYRCSHLTCIKYDNHSLISQLDTLKVSLHRTMVREVEDLTGDERWNFTIGELEISVVDSEQEEEVGREEEASRFTVPTDWTIQVDSSQGVLNAVRRTIEGETVTMWRKEFPAPVVGIWLHNSGQLEKLATNTPTASTSTKLALMLVNYNSQYYIEPVGQAGREQAKLPSTSALGFFPHHELLNHQQSFKVSMQPPLDNHALTLYHDEESFLQLYSSSPTGLAVYFYLDGLGSCGSGEENGSGEHTACHSTAPTEPAPAEEDRHHVLWSLCAAGLSVVKYTLFGLFVLVLNNLHQYCKKIGAVCSEQEEDVVKEGTWLPFIPSTSSTEIATSGYQGDSTQGEKKMESHSRFAKDYDLKGCLGKGGFGVVYHVQNRTDGGEYAVKKIKLPSMKSARQKVMREVHALAQLDHPKIVRYFHSWLEQAPSSWSELEAWASLSRREPYACAEQSPFPSVAGLQAAPSTSSSFSSLNHAAIHSELPSQRGNESYSSSFIIEFKEESSRFKEEGGCFSHQLLSPQDNISSDSSSSCSTEGHSSDRKHCDGFPALHHAEPPTYLFIQMQLCHRESLKDWLGNNIYNRTRHNVLRFFEQMLDAVQYVHDKGMMHRDLKPSNILFSLDGCVKVGDFGLVTGSISPELDSSGTALTAVAEDHHTGNIGSHFYMSPEQTLGVRYDQKVDIFSLGVIFFELHYPFHTEMERAQVLDDLRQHRFPLKFCSTQAAEARFVEWLMAPQSSQRPSACEVYSSACFKQLQKTSEHSVSIIPKL